MKNMSKQLKNNLLNKEAIRVSWRGKEFPCKCTDLKESTFMTTGLDLNVSPEINTWTVEFHDKEGKCITSVHLEDGVELTEENIAKAMKKYKVRFI